MTVACKAAVCGYRDAEGFCSKLTVCVDENGMCEELWRKGVQRPIEQPVPQRPQEMYHGNLDNRSDNSICDAISSGSENVNTME